MNTLKDVLHEMFRQSVIQGATVTGMNTNQLIPIYMEYIAYQIFQLAPIEFEDWMPLIVEQCKQPANPIEALTMAREDLALTLEMVTNA